MLYNILSKSLKSLKNIWLIGIYYKYHTYIRYDISYIFKWLYKKLDYYAKLQ